MSCSPGIFGSRSGRLVLITQRSEKKSSSYMNGSRICGSCKMDGFLMESKYPKSDFHPIVLGVHIRKVKERGDIFIPIKMTPMEIWRVHNQDLILKPHLIHSNNAQRQFYLKYYELDFI